MQVIFSHSLFGVDHRCWESLFPAILWHHQVRPRDWTLRIYHDTTVGAHPLYNGLQKLEEAGFLQLRLVPTAPLTLAMLWRMKPLWEDGDAVVFCRDLDSLPSAKESRACTAFINSGLPAHAIRDNPAHCGVCFMGGMCGFRSNGFAEATRRPSWDAFVAVGRNWHMHGTDQVHLDSILRPAFSGRTLEHVFCGGAPDPNNPSGNIHDVLNVNLPHIAVDIDQKSDAFVPSIGGVAREYTGLLYAADWCRSHGNTGLMSDIVAALHRSDSSIRYLRDKCGYWNL